MTWRPVFVVVIAAADITPPDADGRMWWRWDVNSTRFVLVEMAALDRPCDTCDGHGSFHRVQRGWGKAKQSTCPDCGGSGRHTFEIETGCDCEWNQSDDCLVAQYGCGVDHTHRVHVVPGMVLPVYDMEDDRCPDTPHVCVFHACSAGEPFDQWWYTDADGVTDDITVPAATKPGDWLVQLQVHDA